MDFSEAFSPARALAHGYEGLKRQPVGVLLGGFLIGAAGMCGGGFQGNPGRVDEMPEDMRDAMLAVTAVMVVVGLVFAILTWLALSFLLPGWYRLLRDIVVTGDAQVGALFSGGDAFLRMAGWKLLAGIIALGVAVVSLAPGVALAYVLRDSDGGVAAGIALAVLVAVPALLYVSLGLALGPWVVALEGLDVLAALDRSWELARDHRVDLFLFFLVMGLVNVAGFFCCCVGNFVTRGITDLGTTESFLLATRDDAASFALMRGA